MIIIKIIILYFILIRHIDDFPSTGTRLVYLIKVVLTLRVCVRLCMCVRVRVRAGV